MRYYPSPCSSALGPQVARANTQNPTPESARREISRVIIEISGGHEVVELPTVLAHLPQELLTVRPVRPIVMDQRSQPPRQPTRRGAGIGARPRSEPRKLLSSRVERSAERAGKQRVCDEQVQHLARMHFDTVLAAVRLEGVVASQ